MGNNRFHGDRVTAISCAALEVVELPCRSSSRAPRQRREHISVSLQAVAMTRGAGKGSASVTRFRQQLAPFYTSIWHIRNKPGRGIAQQCSLQIFRHFDDAHPDWFLGSAGLQQLYVVRAGM